MIKVLFVCLGNICRSPLAEAIFNYELNQKDLGHVFSADSAGTAGYHIGDLPDARSRQNARQNGVTIEHRARQFEAVDFEAFDYIITMDESNYQHITTMAKQQGATHPDIHKMRSFQIEPDSLDVPDPYYGGVQGFQQVFDILKDANQRLLRHLLETHKQ